MQGRERATFPRTWQNMWHGGSAISGSASGFQADMRMRLRARGTPVTSEPSPVPSRSKKIAPSHPRLLSRISWPPRSRLSFGLFLIL